ncbi:MAG TPA: tRNA (cytidine(34)-2'-O)-methyltransferase [Azospirillaceae bacterium]|nr:tRNA (cytidine(34)-2'-O)-methyltransferase [Azospirillaceae bacterium]HRQ81084.1 tRNA (cytidine(34)-2'-O)-methyltransferase [Azospirillaceae bacterium]
MRLALFQPDIPQNAGTLMRAAAALGLPVDIIEPCGFILDDKRLRRAVMDYYELLDLTKHASWETYQRDRPPSRVVLLTTAGDTPYVDFAFRPDDTLMVGRESAGVPADVHAAVDARLLIPMKPPARSLNVAVAAAMVLGEALRQTSQWSRP